LQGEDRQKEIMRIEHKSAVEKAGSGEVVEGLEATPKEPPSIAIQKKIIHLPTEVKKQVKKVFGEDDN